MMNQTNNNSCAARKVNSPGLDLMQGFTKQLNGNFAIESNKGPYLRLVLLQRPSAKQAIRTAVDKAIVYFNSPWLCVRRLLSLPFSRDEIKYQLFYYSIYTREPQYMKL